MQTGRTHRRWGLAVAAVSSVAVSLLAVPPGPAGSAPAPVAAPAGAGWFERVATYPVLQNVPDGADPAEETVAEISAVTEDGRTVIYTDAAGKRIGFVDISNPAAPVGTGNLDLVEMGNADDQPTSVAVSGAHVLVVVDTSGGDFANPSGRLDVVRLRDRERVHSLDLGGQPDSIAISPDGAYAAIAIENQRDEEATSEGGGEGDLPQPPAGFVHVVELAGAPQSWTAEPVELAAAALEGMDTPEDPEPEYVDINGDNQLVVTLQENNGLVVVDLPSREIRHAFSAGVVTVEGVDVEDDGRFDPTGTITGPREPDAVQWVGHHLVATANEGDWKGGTRGWTVFDVTSGEVVWDAGASFENLAVAHGLFNDDRADNKGAEPEGLAFEEMGGTPYAFVGSERSNFVAVYDMTDPRKPRFRQLLPTTNGPEGLLPIPSRDLLVVSSEIDDAGAGVRATVGVYALGSARATFPQIVSVPAPGGETPIGWGALGALSGHPTDATRMYAASDAAYTTGRIYSLDLGRTPAVIDEVIEVTAPDGSTPALDVEGLAARDRGGFWLAVEGATGPENRLVRTDAAGVVRESVSLPEDVASRLDKWGLEGVAVQRTRAGEHVYVALQRPLAGEDFARIGRYDVGTREWTWFGYPLEATSTDGDWIGLSEVMVVDGDTLAVIERDKLNGPAAALKRVYTVDVTAGDRRRVTPLTKRFAVDLLPAMRARRGWTQEKLEGLGRTATGRVLAVTDNDGLDDATGETQLFALGALKKVFAASVRTRTTLRASKQRVRRGRPVRLVVRVAPGFADGNVRILDGRRRVRTVAVRHGRAAVRIRLGRPGTHRLRAVYLGDVDSASSRSGQVRVRVLRPRR